MSIRDFMVTEIHGHAISSQLTKDGWEIHLMAPVAGATEEEGGNKFTLVQKCESMSEAIELAKGRAAGVVAADAPVVEKVAEEQVAVAAVAPKLDDPAPVAGSVAEDPVAEDLSSEEK